MPRLTNEQRAERDRLLALCSEDERPTRNKRALSTKKGYCVKKRRENQWICALREAGYFRPNSFMPLPKKGSSEYKAIRAKMKSCVPLHPTTRQQTLSKPKVVLPKKKVHFANNLVEQIHEYSAQQEEDPEVFFQKIQDNNKKVRIERRNEPIVKNIKEDVIQKIKEDAQKKCKEFLQEDKCPSDRCNWNDIDDTCDDGAKTNVNGKNSRCLQFNTKTDCDVLKTTCEWDPEKKLCSERKRESSPPDDDDDEPFIENDEDDDLTNFDAFFDAEDKDAPEVPDDPIVPDTDFFTHKDQPLPEETKDEEFFSYEPLPAETEEEEVLYDENGNIVEKTTGAQIILNGLATTYVLATEAAPVVLSGAAALFSGAMGLGATLFKPPVPHAQDEEEPLPDVPQLFESPPPLPPDPIVLSPRAVGMKTRAHTKQQQCAAITDKVPCENSGCSWDSDQRLCSE